MIKEGGLILETLEGNYPVKLEFEDDSFDLTTAIFHKSGKITCESRKALSFSKFRLVVLDQSGRLREIECCVVELLLNGVIATTKTATTKRSPQRHKDISA